MRRRRSHKRRNNPKHRKHAYNRRRHSKRVRRNKGGKYSSFVKKHKGLFKRLGFKAASRKIGQMWRSKR